MKCDYNLKEPLSILIYFKMSFIPLMAKLNFQQLFSVTRSFRNLFQKCAAYISYYYQCWKY